LNVITYRAGAASVWPGVSFITQFSRPIISLAMATLAKDSRLNGLNDYAIGAESLW